MMLCPKTCSLSIREAEIVSDSESDEPKAKPEVSLEVSPAPKLSAKPVRRCLSSRFAD